MIQAFVFYLFATLVIASATLTITARNPVHSVLWLILAFFNAAGLFLILGAEFIAMLLVIVYVGAVAVLFLFVVMMLDVDFAELRAGFARYLPLGLLLALVLLAGSIVVMPLLARAKRHVGERLRDPLILADAAETRICVLLSISTLLGLGLYTVVGWPWLDPVAGFVIAAFAIHEGREAWEGELVEDDEDET